MVFVLFSSKLVNSHENMTGLGDRSVPIRQSTSNTSAQPVSMCSKNVSTKICEFVSFFVP